MNKWGIAFTGTLVHLLLGTVYAWSYFQSPIVAATGWNNSQVAWAFSLSIFMLGLAAAWGGARLPKYGAKKLAMIGGSLYAMGYLFSAVALHHHYLGLLYLGFGLIGGTGLGLAYVTPVATVSKWFDKHQGMATGMVVMGFGFGALVMSKVLAPFFMRLNDGDLDKTFLHIGIVLLLILPAFAWFLKEPPQESTVQAIKITENPKRHVFEKPFLILWTLFFINITAGMVFIAFQSPLLQDLLAKGLGGNNDLTSAELVKTLAASGATLIAVSSVFNGAGRFVWAALSDRIGRLTTFRMLFLIQAVIFMVLLVVQSPILFSALVCCILLCYGGGFGLVPSLIKDAYGTRLMPIMYGSILTAWSMGGVIGPQLVAYMKDHYADNAGFLVYIISGSLLLIGFGVSFLYKPLKID